MPKFYSNYNTVITIKSKMNVRLIGLKLIWNLIEILN